MGQITSKIAGVENQRIALGPATARRILIRAFEIGRFSTNPQIHRYSLDSALTTVDTEMLIRHGKIAEESYDRDFDCLVYRVTGKVDGRTWEITVALECEEDYWESPWITLMSAQQTARFKKEKLA